jgi:hypothetical protein
LTIGGKLIFPGIFSHMIDNRQSLMVENIPFPSNKEIPDGIFSQPEAKSPSGSPQGMTADN